jgi:hypothetical protein
MQDSIWNKNREKYGRQEYPIQFRYPWEREIIQQHRNPINAVTPNFDLIHYPTHQVNFLLISNEYANINFYN